nr:SAP domain-containing protein [Photorhabdus heterorhabditis]
MSEEAFENGYFYVVELRQFAKSLGIASDNLKKHELELHIRSHLFGYSGDLPIPFILQVAALLAAFTYPSHIVIYAPGDAFTRRRAAI